MKRLLILTGSIWILILTLGNLIILYGRSQITPLPLAGIDTCGGVTCYAGIVPGVTTWSEAVRAWGNSGNALENINYGSMDIDFGTSVRAHLMQSRDLDLVTFMQLKIDPAASPALGTALLRYGMPCALTLSSGIWMLRYPDFILDLDTPPGGMPRPSTRITGIFLNGNKDLCNIRTDNLRSTWRGLVTYFRVTQSP